MSAETAWPMDPPQCLPTGASPFEPLLSPCTLQDKETGSTCTNVEFIADVKQLPHAAQ